MWYYTYVETAFLLPLMIIIRGVRLQEQGIIIHILNDLGPVLEFNVRVYRIINSRKK